MIQRSLGDKLAHVLERSGLALVGATCGLFIAAFFARSQVAGTSLEWLLLALTAIGALGFYLGIDIPPSAAPTEGSGPDLIELFSALGTFLTAFASFASAVILIADVYPKLYWPAAVLLSWLIGVILQIAAGTMARLRR